MQLYKQKPRAKIIRQTKTDASSTLTSHIRSMHAIKFILKIGFCLTIIVGWGCGGKQIIYVPVNQQSSSTPSVNIPLTDDKTICVGKGCKIKSVDGYEMEQGPGGTIKITADPNYKGHQSIELTYEQESIFMSTSFDSRSENGNDKNDEGYESGDNENDNEEAKRIIEEANKKAKEIRQKAKDEAKSKAETEAKEEAKRIIEKAETEAARIRQEAETEAEKVKKEAARIRQEAETEVAKIRKEVEEIILDAEQVAEEEKNRIKDAITSQTNTINNKLANLFQLSDCLEWLKKLNTKIEKIQNKHGQDDGTVKDMTTKKKMIENAIQPLKYIQKELTKINEEINQLGDNISGTSLKKYKKKIENLHTDLKELKQGKNSKEEIKNIIHKFIKDCKNDKWT